MTTIDYLDVQRYMGTRYEIAKYPKLVPKKCVAETKAEYRLQAGGSVQVINRCRRENGEKSTGFSRSASALLFSGL